ncbi:helix-turn-helix domain-containing protein [Micromonospora sp. CPCC 205739]|uniref:helix-turn-helix domain-containing protein n=1 Tax=unclassified Micromonospora TaxID=2617518 RepID=UPI003FA58D2F
MAQVMHANTPGKQLAEANGWAPSKVSRLENGRQMPSPADIHAWGVPVEPTRLLRICSECSARSKRCTATGVVGCARVRPLSRTATVSLSPSRA